MKYDNQEISSVGALIEAISTWINNVPTVWYRGQADASWKLQPTSFRDTYAPFTTKKELDSIKRFKQNALLHLPVRPSTEAEWIFLMRHHAVPTRLIDWTESPLVGLYFAASANPNSDGTLWCLCPEELNDEAGIDNIPGFDDDIALQNYLPSSVAGPGANASPIAAIGVRNSARMYAQQGMFTISHKDVTPIEEIGAKTHVWRLNIPKKAKSNILKQLEFLRVDRLSLFPELDSVAEVARKVME